MITADDADFSEPRIDGLALERQHAEDALMDAAQRLAADEALERLDAEREFANGERALAAEAAGAKTLEVGGLGVLGAVDDAQVLAPARLERGLDEAAAAAGEELERLDDHPLAAAFGKLFPPCGAGALTLGVGGVDDDVRGWMEQVVRGAEVGECLHVPEVVLVDVDAALACEQVEGGELEVVDRAHRPAVAPVGVHEVGGGVGAGAGAFEQGAELAVDPPARGVERGDGLAQAEAGRRSDGRVLPAQQLLGLGRPGHQLAVEQEPIGLEPLEQLAALGRVTHTREQLPLDLVVVVAADDDDRPRAHVLLRRSLSGHRPGGSSRTLRPGARAAPGRPRSRTGRRRAAGRRATWGWRRSGPSPRARRSR